MAAAERRLAIPTPAFPHQWRWPTIANLNELVSNIRGRQMIKLDSLRIGESRSKYRKEAKSAYQTLDQLIEQVEIVQLDNNREIRLRKGPIIRRGYEGVMAITANINQLDGKDSSCVAHFSLSEQGTTGFSLPGSMFIEDTPVDDALENGNYPYTQPLIHKRSATLQVK